MYSIERVCHSRRPIATPLPHLHHPPLIWGGAHMRRRSHRRGSRCPSCAEGSGVSWLLSERPLERGRVPDRGRSRRGDASVQDDRVPAGAQRSSAGDPRGPVLPGSGASRSRLPPRVLRGGGICLRRPCPASAGPRLRSPLRAGRLGRRRSCGLGRPAPSENESEGSRGLCHQEAAQAYGQEEAPQAAEAHARAASQQEVSELRCRRSAALPPPPPAAAGGQWRVAACHSGTVQGVVARRAVITAQHDPIR